MGRLLSKCWLEIYKHTSWYFKIMSYRMKFCIGVEFWFFDSVKAVYSPTIWWRTPEIYREAGIDYATYPAATVGKTE